MIFLVLGIVVWSSVHFIPSLGAAMRAGWIERVGEGPYKGLFALSLVAAIALMVFGWRSAEPIGVYAPPAWGATFNLVAMFVALLLFLGSGVPTNLKRIVRHPQLSGVALWAFAHLLANGDRRSLVLFGGLLLWAVAEMIFINRRDGAWRKPEPLPLVADLKPLVAAVVAYALLAFAHPYIAGVSAFTG